MERYKLYILFAGAVLLWIVFTGVVVVSSMPLNPASFSYPFESSLKRVIPEGFGFFTRDPREPDIHIYRLKGGQWEKNNHLPISSPSNFFGVKRLPRAQSVEMALILDKIKPEDWNNCKGNILECLRDEKNIRSIVSNLRNPIFCGTISFVRQEPVPWSWADLHRDFSMPSNYTIVDLQCDS